MICMSGKKPPVLCQTTGGPTGSYGLKITLAIVVGWKTDKFALALTTVCYHPYAIQWFIWLGWG